MMSCRDDHATVHHDWLRIVESYVHRRLTDKNDRFPALAGLATRLSLAEGGRAQYLAGLWLTYFGRDLAWSLNRATTALTRDKELSQSAPSWSWASLPLETDIVWGKAYLKSDGFEVVSPENAAADSTHIKEVEVRGKLRPFFTPGCLRELWDAVRRVVDGVECFEFNPGRDAYAVDVASGRIVSYEARKKEVDGRLDYEDDVKLIAGGEFLVYGLEIGQATMLLLQKDETSGDIRYKRVGICENYRSGFFRDVEVESIRMF